MSRSYSSRGRNSSSFSSRNLRTDPFAPRTLPGDRDIMEGLCGAFLQTISQIPSRNADEEVKITEFRYVGSYNWTERPTPTIIVPGSPPQWQNRPPPYQVQPDLGLAFKDQNGYRMPKDILLPLIVAVEKKAEVDGEDFDWASTDFVTDRNNLRKLLRWIGGGSPSDFRIDIQLAGKHTVLLNRWENRYKEEMSGMTFGFNFEKASTHHAKGCRDSTGHHRIVQYDLNGLKMVLRFEVDACIPSETTAVAPRSKTPSAKVPSSNDVDDLASALSSVTLQTSESSSASLKPTKRPVITVISGGSYIPQSSIVELTTRSERNASTFDWKESYPQLFLSQTPHHFLGIHQRGRFTAVNKRKLDSPELKKIATDYIQGDMKKLRHVLSVIKELAVKHGERGRLSLVCRGGELMVYERVSQDSCLPDEFLQRFDV